MGHSVVFMRLPLVDLVEHLVEIGGHGNGEDSLALFHIWQFGLEGLHHVLGEDEAAEDVGELLKELDSGYT